MLLTEASLSLFNKNNQLFTGSKDGLLTLNRAYFEKYGNNQCSISIPFSKEKDKNTFRIFILGNASSTDVPQNPNASLSHILNSLLQRSFSDKNFEVINISVNEANSFVQRDIAKQLKQYNPDLVLICPGQNEFYGQHARNWISYQIKNSNIAQNISKLWNSAPSDHLSPIDTNSSAFESVVSKYETNLDQTVLDLQGNNIKVVLINSAINLLDSFPEMSCFTSPDSIRLTSLYKAGEEAFSKNSFDTANKYFSEIYKKDKAHAATCYYLGRLALQNNDDKNARLFLEKALENDKIKRGSSKINDITFKIAAIRGCTFIDAENLFSQYSPHGIPGNNLFLDNEPNISGNMVIALECYRFLLADKIIQPQKCLRPSDYHLAFTPFDSAYDYLCSVNSVKGNTAPPISYIRQNNASNMEEKMASLFIERKTNWEDSMNSLYEYYISQKNYRLAFKVIENLALENPYNTSVNQEAARTAALMGDSQLVIHYANKVFNHKPGYEMAQHLFLNYLKLDLPDKALPYLNYARYRKGSELQLIYNATREIIDLKKMLKNDPDNQEIKDQIALQYKAMGNDDVALIYFGSGKAASKS